MRDCMWGWLPLEGLHQINWGNKSFQEMIVEAYGVIDTQLRGCKCGAYSIVLQAATDEGLAGRQAECAVALYFAVNHDLSPIEDDLSSGEAFIPLQPFMEDASAWVFAHPDAQPKEAFEGYAKWALREKPVTTDSVKAAMNQLGLQIFAEPEQIAKVNVVKLKDVFYPVDKVNSVIWSLLDNDANNFPPIAVEKRGSKKQLDIAWSINFDAIEDKTSVSTRLTQYDKRVYVAMSSLHRSGNEFVTLHQIHEAMGNKGEPSQNQRAKMSESMWKMSKVWFELDNTSEAGSYNYPRYVYKGSLLPIESIKTIVNGNLVEETIHLLREPPASTFAYGRKQVTAFPVKLLASPVSKTEANIAIEDCLLRRISHAKNGAGQSRILYEYIVKEAKVTERNQKQRVPEKVRKYLSHYIACGFISNFTEDKNGVNVSF